jgi:hypothetical protein
MNYGQAKTEHESMRANMAQQNPAYNPHQNGYQYGAIGGAEQCEKQSHIFTAAQQIYERVEQSLCRFDELVHRLRVVSRDPNLAREEKQSMPNRDGDSELAQRLNGIVNRLDELNRRIAMQLDMLEV